VELVNGGNAHIAVVHELLCKRFSPGFGGIWNNSFGAALGSECLEWPSHI